MATAGYEIRINGGTPIDVGNVLTTLLSTLRGQQPPPNETDDFEIRSYSTEGARSEWSAIISATVSPNLDSANIYCSGNSLTEGNPDYAPWDYPTRLATIMTDEGVYGFTVTNIGHDAAETNGLVSLAVTELYPFDDAARRNIAIINEIGNDIYFNGDAAAAITRFTDWYDDIIADGWEVLVVNMAHRGNPASGSTPFGDTEAQYQTKLATARSLLTAWATANDVPIVQLMADTRLSDCSNATYYVDRTHHTHAGYLAMAEDIFAGLLAMPYTDTLAPLLSTLSVEDDNHAGVIFTYNERLDESSVPAVGDFAFSGGRTATAVDVTLNVVTVTVDTPYSFGNVITASYTPGTNKIQDLSGNDAASLTTEPVDNNTLLAEIALVFTGMVNMSQVGTTLSATAGSDWDHYGKATYKLPASTDGYIKARFPTENVIFGFNTANVAATYTGMEYFGYASGGLWYYGLNGSPTATAESFAADDSMRLERVAGVLSLYRVRAGVDQLLWSFAGTNNADLFINAAIYQAGSGYEIEIPVGAGIVVA